MKIFLCIVTIWTGGCGYRLPDHSMETIPGQDSDCCGSSGPGPRPPPPPPPPPPTPPPPNPCPSNTMV